MLAGLGRACGLLYQLALAWRFGDGPAMDRWFFLYGSLVLGISLFGAVVQAGFGPLLARCRGEGAAAEFLTRALPALARGVLVLLLGAALAGAALIRFAGGGGWGQLAAILLILGLDAWGLVVRVSLHMDERFQLPAVATALRGGGALLLLPLLVRLGPALAAPLALAGGSLLQLIALAALLRVSPLAPRPALLRGPASPAVQRALSGLRARLGPIAIGEAAVSANPVIDRLFAAGLPPGALARLGFADRLRVIPETLMSLGLVTVVFTHWARLAHEGQLEQHARRVLGRLAALATPVLLLGWGLRDPLLRLALSGGALSEGSVARVGVLLGGYLPGLPALLLAILCARLLALVAPPRWLLWQGLASCGLNLLANLLLVPWLGSLGLALATSLVNLLMLGLLDGLLRRRGVRVLARLQLGLGWGLAAGGAALLARFPLRGAAHPLAWLGLAALVAVALWPRGHHNPASADLQGIP